LNTFIRLVIEILKQYSTTQPGVVPKLVATNLGTTPGCVVEYCFSIFKIPTE